MQKLYIRSIVVFIFWLVTASISMVGAVFSQSENEGPKSLDYHVVQQTTVRLSHHNAELWHVNGLPVLKQQKTSHNGLVSSLDLTDYRSINAHLSQATRLSLRVTPVALAQQVRVESYIIANVFQESTHKATIQIIIDPKKQPLHVQSRRGMRSAWRHSSSVVSLIHSVLLKEERITV